MIQQILSVKINSLIQWIILFFTRMFENRIRLNGSAYLAEPYSPTSVQIESEVGTS